MLLQEIILMKMLCIIVFLIGVLTSLNKCKRKIRPRSLTGPCITKREWRLVNKVKENN